MTENKSVIILGANSDIAKYVAINFYKKNYKLTLLSRNIDQIRSFLISQKISPETIDLIKMDLKNIEAFEIYYKNLKIKHDIVICAIGELVSSNDNLNNGKLDNMININYIYPSKCLEIISNNFVKENSNKERIILGISSLAGERGRAVNFHYGAAKSAFTVFLSGLRQKLSFSQITVITVSLGFVKTKMTKDLKMSSFLSSRPEKIANDIIKCVEQKKLIFTPTKWKLIMFIIKLMPEFIFKNLKF